MAEGIVTFFLEKLSELLAQEASLLFGVDREVRSLQRELQWMQSMLKDAAVKRRENERVRIWVTQIREVAYDAEDVIDSFIVQRDRQERRRNIRFRGSIIRIMSSTTQLARVHEFGRKIKEIKKRTAEISANRSKYGIECIRAGEASSSSLEDLQQKHSRTYIIEESNVVGIEDDAKELAQRLIMGGIRRAVISIVGMGGVGKTTLAKKVYNSRDVEKHFDCCAWVYGSQEYAPRALLQSLIRSIMVFPTADMEIVEKMNVVDLANKLNGYLKERRYLVVVDDIWNKEAWDVLEAAFPDAMKGSRVLLTTRNKDVALYPDAQSLPQELKFLSEHKSWELFCMKAFPGNARTSCPPELETVGKDIVTKCCGLPLAIVVLGGMLSRKQRLLSKWENFYRSATWQLRESENRIMDILSLSYNGLPYYLKSCFLYCSVFPEDSEIPTGKLVRLWIAEGFIQQRGAETTEEVATDYLEELIHRSMIQVAKLSSSGRVKTCRIHDLLRDISIYEAKEDGFFSLYTDENKKAPITARGLAVHCSNIFLIRSCLKFRSLRSLLRFNNDVNLEKNFGKNFLGGLKLLRVLDLEGVSLTQMPNEIGELLHLRYLGLRKTGIQTVPSSMGNLRNLQTLDIRENPCKTLPNAFFKNQFLRHLYISKCSFQNSNVLHVNVVDVPEHTKMSDLRNLETVVGIKAGNWRGESLEKLTNLRKLGIGGVLSSHGVGLIHSMEKLDRLYSMWLAGDAILALKLSHHCHLHKMYFCGVLEKVPDLQEFPTNLTNLILNSTQLKEDPFLTLEKLPKLRILKLVQNAYLGKVLCFKGGFPQLVILEIRQLNELEKLILDLSPYEGKMPRLHLLCISECMRLRILPEELPDLHSLRELKLLNCPAISFKNFGEFLDLMGTRLTMY